MLNSAGSSVIFNPHFKLPISVYKHCIARRPPIYVIFINMFSVLHKTQVVFDSWLRGLLGVKYCFQEAVMIVNQWHYMAQFHRVATALKHFLLSRNEQDTSHKLYS